MRTSTSVNLVSLSRVFASRKWVALLVPAVVACAGLAQNTYRIDSPGSSSIIGHLRLSNNGQVVVGTHYSGSGQFPFRYTIPGGVTTLPFTGGYMSGNAMGCNHDGSLAAVIFTQVAVGVGQTYRWGTGNTYLPLGLSFPGADIQFGAAMSADGATIVGEVRQLGGAVQASRWRQSTGWVTLGALAPQNSRALGVSSDGNWIVGDTDSPASAISDEAFRYHPSIGMHGLGFIAGGYPYSSAVDVSDDGSVVVGTGSHDPAINVPRKGFRWVATGPTTGVLTAIDHLPGFPRAYTTACSRDGSVVVGAADSLNPNFTPAGWIWTPDTGTRDAATFLSSIGANMSVIGLVTSITDISDDGTVLIGSCRYNNQSRAFMVTGVPCLREPGLALEPSPGDYCEGATITRMALPANSYSGNITYTWKRDGIPLANGQTPGGSFIVNANTAELTIYASVPDDSGEYTCTMSNPCGSSTTTSVPINVYGYPSVANGPYDTEVCTGLTGYLSVTPVFTGPHQPRYQWYRWASGRGGFFAWRIITNGATILGTTYSGATSPVLAIANAQSDAATQYYCEVRSPCHVATSPIANVSIASGSVYFTDQPLDVTTCPSGAAVFSVIAGPPSNITYQWDYESSPGNWTPIVDGTAPWGSCALISGATTPTLTVTPDPVLTDSLTTNFRCVAINACSATVSNSAAFVVCPADYNCDGGVDGQDIGDFFNDWSNAASGADLNCDGGIDGDDTNFFFMNWSEGC
jgi:uncharacterized membrane protein